MSDQELPDARADRPDADDADDADDATSVLELFGVELKVRNKRLAEVLQMDAKEALTSDIRQLVDAEDMNRAAAETAQAVPDVVLRPPSARDEDEARHRLGLRERVDALGRKLGFGVDGDGMWRSPIGITLMMRVVERDLTEAAAADLVRKVEQRRAELVGPDSSALYVAEDRASLPALSQAIRQAQVCDYARAICLEDLEFMGSLESGAVLDHRSALVLLSPTVDTDVGELLRIIRSAAG